jgi:hypothetical protein
MSKPGTVAGSEGKRVGRRDGAMIQDPVSGDNLPECVAVAAGMIRTLA